METKKDHSVMVPYDFTSVSDVALAHAGNFCKITGRPLTALNIMDESTKSFLKKNNQNEQFINTKLEEICNDISAKYNIKTSVVIRKGKILSIRDIARELAISFMFIGIDQPQRRASKILQMIGLSPAPVYVVQGNVDWKPIRTIIFPVDEFEETRQKISIAGFLANLTGAQLKLFSTRISDRNAHVIQEVRTKQIEKLLAEDNIPFTTEYAKLNEKKFAGELLEFAQLNNADVMILMKTPRVFFPSLFIAGIDKKVLLNSMNIPSIYVNAKDVGKYN